MFLLTVYESWDCWQERRKGKHLICDVTWTLLLICPDDQQLLVFDLPVCSPNLPLSSVTLQGQRCQLLVSLHNHQYIAFPHHHVSRLSSSVNPTHLVPLLILYAQYTLRLYNHLRLHLHGNGGSDNSLHRLHHQMNLSTNNVCYSIHSYIVINTWSIDLSPSNPVIFCHGLLGFDSVTIGPAIAPLEVTHWRGIKEVLEQNGTQVLITRVPATSSPVDRAKVLEQKISSVYPGRSVHLIGQYLFSTF